MARTNREAAVQVLQDEGEPRNYRVITRLAKERGYLETDAEHPEQSMDYELNADCREGVADGLSGRTCRWLSSS